MADRNGTGKTPHHPAERRKEQVFTPEDQRLNDDIHAVLRDAAELREGRAQAQLAANIDAAKRQFDAVVAMARGRSGKVLDKARATRSRAGKSRA